jgi:hypothetical protein
MLPRNPKLGVKICSGFRTIPTIRTGLCNPEGPCQGKCSAFLNAGSWGGATSLGMQILPQNSGGHQQQQAS